MNFMTSQSSHCIPKFGRAKHRFELYPKMAQTMFGAEIPSQNERLCPDKNSFPHPEILRRTFELNEPVCAADEPNFVTSTGLRGGEDAAGVCAGNCRAFVD